MTSQGSLVAFPVGTLDYMAPEDIANSAFVGEVQSTLKSDIWALGVLLSVMISGDSPFLLSTDDARGLYALILQQLQFCGLEISVNLLESKMSDLHQHDLELLRQRESGISGFSKSNAKDPEKEPREVMYFEERNAAHVELRQRQQTQLQEWFSGPAFCRISQDMKDIIEICLTVDPEKRPTPAELIRHPFFSCVSFFFFVPCRAPF